MARVTRTLENVVVIDYDKWIADVKSACHERFNMYPTNFTLRKLNIPFSSITYSKSCFVTMFKAEDYPQGIKLGAILIDHYDAICIALSLDRDTYIVQPLKAHKPMALKTKKVEELVKDLTTEELSHIVYKAMYMAIKDATAKEEE